MTDELEDRSIFLVDVLKRYADKDDSILEIGSGSNRNIRFLKNAGYTNVTGIDKNAGSAIEDVPEDEYDIIFTMSCLFLIPIENEWVFEKIARMAKRYIITIEGETTKSNGVIGRDYTKIFSQFGFKEVEHQTDVFNEYGVLRVLKRI